MTTLEHLAGLARAAETAERLEAAAGGLHTVRLHLHRHGILVIVDGAVAGDPVHLQKLVSWDEIEYAGGSAVEELANNLISLWTQEARKREERQDETAA